MCCCCRSRRAINNKGARRILNDEDGVDEDGEGYVMSAAEEELQTARSALVIAGFALLVTTIGAIVSTVAIGLQAFIISENKETQDIVRDIADHLGI